VSIFSARIKTSAPPSGRGASWRRSCLEEELPGGGAAEEAAE